MRNFLGVPYPVVSTPLGYFYSQSGAKQIKSDLLVLLMTNPGERCMEPFFGTPLRTLIFEPNDVTVQLQAKNMIINSIKSWEPRVAIQSIVVEQVGIGNTSMLNKNDLLQDLGNILFIQIIFIDPQNIKEVQELTLEIPLAGGS